MTPRDEDNPPAVSHAAGPAGAKPRQGKLRRMLFSIVKIAVIVYIVFGAILFVFQKRFIYMPSREMRQDPGSLGLEFEELTLTASDGVKIFGWYIPAKADKGTVIFCHGNAGNISGRLPTIGLFHAIGMNVMIFDYRGYGRSEGSPGEAGTYRDASAAWDYVTAVRGEKPERIIVFGRSLGGAIAAHLAETKKPAGLILESTFTSVPDMARKMYPVYPTRLLSRVKYDTLKRIDGLECPIMILHSVDDEMIPYEHGRKLFGAAPEPKRFVEMQGSHNEARPAGVDYQRTLGEFIDEQLRQ